MTSIGEWRARRRWLRNRERNYVREQLASEAAYFLEHPQPVHLGHWRTVVVGRRASSI